jgi:hypothetical protein
MFLQLRQFDVALASYQPFIQPNQSARIHRELEGQPKVATPEPYDKATEMVSTNQPFVCHKVSKK